MQRDVLPRERHRALGPLVGERHGVQGRVQQRRVDAEAGGRHVLGQRDLGEHLVAQFPRGPQPLERVPVLEPELREPLVGALDPHCLGPGGRPHGGVEVRGRRAARQETGSVLGPRQIAVLRTAVNRDRPALAPSAHADLHLHCTRLRQHERRRDRQLVNPVEAHLVRGPQRELDQRGAGHEDLAVQRVIPQPRVSAQRQPAREQQALSARELDGGPEQRVLDRAETGRPHVRLGGHLGPEPLLLERVRRQVDLAAMLTEPVPINIDAVNIDSAQCSQH